MAGRRVCEYTHACFDEEFSKNRGQPGDVFLPQTENSWRNKTLQCSTHKVQRRYFLVSLLPSRFPPDSLAACCCFWSAFSRGSPCTEASAHLCTPELCRETLPAGPELCTTCYCACCFKPTRVKYMTTTSATSAAASRARTPGRMK